MAALGHGLDVRLVSCSSRLPAWDAMRPHGKRANSFDSYGPDMRKLCRHVCVCTCVKHYHMSRPICAQLAVVWPLPSNHGKEGASDRCCGARGVATEGGGSTCHAQTAGCERAVCPPPSHQLGVRQPRESAAVTVRRLCDWAPLSQSLLRHSLTAFRQQLTQVLAADVSKRAACRSSVEHRNTHTPAVGWFGFGM